MDRTGQRPRRLAAAHARGCRPPRGGRGDRKRFWRRCGPRPGTA